MALPDAASGTGTVEEQHMNKDIDEQGSRRTFLRSAFAVGVTSGTTLIPIHQIQAAPHNQATAKTVKPCIFLRPYKRFLPIPLFVAVISSSSAETPQLVVRDQARLTLAGAQTVLKAAEEQAEALAVRENIAVVDEGGHLLACARMDGARSASVATALTKAVSAAMMRSETGPVFKGASPEHGTLNLAIEHAAAASGGTLTIVYGGIPILFDGQVVGAIGVGGGSEEQDVSVGRAGAAALPTATPGKDHNSKRP
jgi:glc operon protein GlcG